MKKSLYFISFILLFAFSACNGEDSYSDLQKKEEQTINTFIAQEEIKIVKTFPTTWDANTYYESLSGLYFRLEEKGDTTVAMNTTSRTKVGFRAIEYELDEDKTVRFNSWESGDVSSGKPITFTYGDSYAITSLGAGIYEAIGLMRYKNSVANIIVPSDLNTSSYSDILKPVGYRLKITVIE